MSDAASDAISRIVSTRANESRVSRESEHATRVRKAIEAIQTAYHDDWAKQKLEFARHFLSQTWAGIPLPVLSVCGRGTQEIRYSTYLAYLLDGSKPHGLGTRYLHTVLARLDKDDLDTHGSIVETEKWLGSIAGKNRPTNCYCDIVVSGADFFVFIENKIKSSESANPESGDNQLLRYDMAIRDNPDFRGKSLIKVYLTPTGRESTKSPGWIGMSYSDLVKAGLDVLRAGGLSGNARENIKRFLIDLSLGPFDTAETEIQELVALAEQAATTNRFQSRLRFDQMVSRNNALVGLLMEG